MSFDWRDYLTLAQSMVADQKDANRSDAEYRTAISRAYYAVHHTAKIRLKEKDYDRNIPTGDRAGQAHRYVRDKFLDDVFEERKQIGLLIGQLLRNRGRADYEPVFKRLADTAKVSVKLAQDAIQLIEALP